MILVFGAGGQLGRALQAAAHDDGTALTALTHAEADVTDAGAVAGAIKAITPTVIVNAAAYNAVDRAEVEIEDATRANGHGPAVVGSASAAARVPLIHVSTDYVFDGAKDGPYRETDPVHPLGVYAKSKLEGEAAVRRIQPRHILVRTAWLFSPHGANFVTTIVRLAGEREELNVIADQRGSPTSAADLARALLIAAAAIGRGQKPWGTYHFAGRGETTRHGMALRIVAAQRAFTGLSPVVNAVTSAAYGEAAPRPKNSVLDSSKFAATFGFRAAVWEEAVDRTVAELFSVGGQA